MRLLLFALSLCLAAVAGAHQDPLGEIHPRVTANLDGSFTVTLRYFVPEREGWMRMMIGADGAEIVPRHWIKDRNSDSGTGRDEKSDLHIGNVSAEESGVRPAVIEPPGLAGAREAKMRVLPIEHPGYGDEARAVAGNEAAFTFGDLTERTDDGMPFKLTWCRRDGFQPGRNVTLGNVACIYDFPSASPLVWTAGRWWVAWVEPRKKDERVTWTTVLTSVDPESGKVEHHDLPGLSNWNTGVAIAVNATGTLCVAWHASLDGSYPGTAKIVTAVFTPGK